MLCAFFTSISVFGSTIIVPPNEQLVLRDIQKQVNSARLEQDVTTLVGFGTRHTLSETKSTTQGIGAARRWGLCLKRQFTRSFLDTRN